MTALKRRNFVPVIPALGLAAVAAAPIANLLASGSSPVGTRLATQSGPGLSGEPATPPAAKTPDGSEADETHAAPAANAAHTGRHRPDKRRRPLHHPKSGPTTTTVFPGGATTTTAAPATATTTTAPVTTTLAPSTTSTTVAPAVSPLKVTEQFTQLAAGKPMLVQLVVSNTSSTAQSITMTVDIKGSALGHYLNVNNDGTQTNPANWSCSPNEVQSPAADNVFTCKATIPAATANTVMATTGSNVATAATGTTVTVTSTVTADTPGGSPFPSPVAVTATVG